MTEQEAMNELTRCLETVFGSVPKTRRGPLFREMAFVETLAKEGVKAYTDKCNAGGDSKAKA